MPRKRLRPDYVRRNYTYACQIIGPVPQRLWDTARAMQGLWNGLVAQHEALRTDGDADTSPEVTRTAYAQFWATAYLYVRDEGERLGLAVWCKWYVYDTFRTAQQRFARHQGGPPRAHLGLRQIIVPHRTASGGVPIDWLWRDGERKHTAILAHTSGHHWQDAYMTVGGERVPLRVLLHRPLPEDAVLKRVALLGTFEPALRQAGHDGWQWRFQCSVEVPPPAPAAPVGRTMGLDLGWRVRPEGLRLAVVTDGVHCWEWLLPWDLASRALRRRQRYYAARQAHCDATGQWRQCWERQSRMDAALEACKAGLAALETSAWPEAARTRIRLLGRMRAAGLRRLRHELGSAGITLPVLEAWHAEALVQARRLRGSWLRILRARQDLYRHLADWLARHADVVAWEGDLDLKELAETVTDMHAIEEAKKYRQMAGLSQLRQCIREALDKRGRTLLDCPAAMTTQTCAVDGCGAPVAPTAALHAVCAQGHREDQDVTAARNLWRQIPAAHRPEAHGLPLVDRGPLRRSLFLLDASAPVLTPERSQ